MTLITRAQWGARSPRKAPVPVAITARTEFFVHYDGATPLNLPTQSDVYAKVRGDQNYHMDAADHLWNDIGYNFLVVSGGVLDGALVEGRGRDVVGAHCYNHNTSGIGVQVAIGGAQRPTPAALATVRRLYDECSAAAGHALAKKGHRDGFATACPGDILEAWVKAGMPAATGGPVTTPKPPASDVPPVFSKPPAPRPPAPTPKPPTVTPAPVLRLGSKGAAVQRLQLGLNRCFPAYSHLVVDGSFGPATSTVVHEFQRRSGLVPDGEVGPNTRAALKRVGITF